MASKQVIVMRKFPGLRTGKYIAQGAHASMGALLKLVSPDLSSEDKLVLYLKNPEIKEWLRGSFTKITVYVETEEALLEVYKQAQEVDLPCALIQDAGRTEFKGIPTYTAVGVGPGNVDAINKITGHLPLF